MTHFEHRILRIVGVSPAEANAKLNIKPITIQIKDICSRVFKRIISDPSHPITAALQENPRKPGHFIVPMSRKSRHHDSFMVSQLRTMRDGRTDLYTNSNAAEQLPSPLSN